jgi:Ni,Fe-hydrogenase III large subunit/Ni,Fe-hydrogenase III component G
VDLIELMSLLESKYGLRPLGIEELHGDEVYIKSVGGNFSDFCLALHKELSSTVMTMFAREMNDTFRIYCAFLGKHFNKWFFVTLDIEKDPAKFHSIAKEIFSASNFEREMKEMFGIDIDGNPDGRRLRLHDEVWPNGYYPLRKDFMSPAGISPLGEYSFSRVHGEGIYEIPVGPVHAGIIGPGHFRFSVAGEPIINLEIRLGFTHRGVEKLMEGKTISDALKISECISGDSPIAHSWAFLNAAEKTFGTTVPEQALRTRAVLLELERIYNHISDIGGIALDVGFTHPAAFASIIKENIHQLNDKICGHRFLKGVLVPGGVSKYFDQNSRALIINALSLAKKDLFDLKKTLLSSVSFLDRVDTTGHLSKKIAEDLGVMGLVGRASGIDTDLRRDMPSIYRDHNMKVPGARSGDVLARLLIRFDEIEDSIRLINEMLDSAGAEAFTTVGFTAKEGFGLGYTEGWRGPVLYWVSIDKAGNIERCKVTDPSFRNWQGLSYAVLENIVPDFPVCNKSFDLSYSGNDL